MKKDFLFTLTVLLIALAFLSCKKNNQTAPADGEVFSKDASYALGMNLGASLAMDGIYPDLDELLKGLKDRLNGGELRFNEQEAGMIFEEAYYSMMEKKQAESADKENVFLAENSKKSGVIVTASGLQYEIISEGFGQKPLATDTVKVHYEGKLTDGTVFDSSYARAEPVEFPLNGVIPGWTEGVQLMNVGSKFKFYIHSSLAYGANGGGPIPPYSTLIFEVELLDIIR